MTDGWNGERQIGKYFGEIEPKHIGRYNIATRYTQNKDVLDAACGCGYGTNLLGQRGAKSVVGVDNSKEALEYAAKWWNFVNVQFKEFNLERPDFDELGLFDAIVSFETIEHLVPMPSTTLEKFDEILKPEGFLIYSHPECESPLTRAKFHKHFNIEGDELIRWMEQYGYEKVFEWLQPSRSRIFKFPYHVVVLKKCKL